MSKRVHIKAVVNAANVSKDGAVYTIRDVCGAVDDIVMNQRLYPAKELAKGAPSMRGKPAPAGHPKNKDGKHISATNGEALMSAWIGAYCANSRHEGGRTLTDILVNGDMAKATPRGSELVERLEAAIAGSNVEPIHVSTGLNLEEVVANGESRGKKYTSIATNIQYDHLAILLNETGAGTPEEGVGMFVNSAGQEEEIETIEVNAEPADRRFEGIKGWLHKLVTNSGDISFDQITSEIMAKLPDGAWPREVFSNYFVWCDRDGKLLKQDYALSSDGSLTFVGQAVEVTRKVEYEPITNHQRTDPVKENMIAVVNAAGVSGVAAMTDAQLQAAYDAVKAKPHIDALAAANAELEKFKTAANAAADTELNALATELAVNSALTVDQLKKLGLEDLRALKTAAKAAPVTVGNSATKKPGDEFAGYSMNSHFEGAK